MLMIYFHPEMEMFMNMSRVSALAYALAIGSGSAIAQDVVMRRPLPSIVGVTSIPDDVTPTPAPPISPSPTSPTVEVPPTQTARYPVYVSVGMCGAMEAGKMWSLCLEIDENGVPAMASDNAMCAAQSPTNPAYLAQIPTYQGFYSIIPPDQALTADGSNCSSVVILKTYGSTCQNAASSCYEISYEVDPYVQPSAPRYLSATPTATTSCKVAQSTADEGVADMVVKAGFTPAGPLGTEACTPPDMYAAQGSCVTNSTQNTDGSTSISMDFVQRCYAVRDLDPIYGTWQLSPASNAQCDSADNTPEEKELIARYLSPYLVDPTALVKNCYLGGGIALNYQRDTESDDSRTVNARTFLATYQNSVKWPSGFSDYEIRQIDISYPYVCTDVDRGYSSRPAYFANAKHEGSTYDVERYPCNVAREADKEALRRTVEEAVRVCSNSADADDRADGRTLTGKSHCVAPDIGDDGSFLKVSIPFFADLHS